MNKTIARKPAPDVKIGAMRVDQRKAILTEWDKKEPDFVHSYQAPGAVTGDATVAWEMEVKGQEVVKNGQGKVVHHMGDPVVRRRRSDWEAERKAEADRSREDVEAKVKPDNSTVYRAPKAPREAQGQAG